MNNWFRKVVVGILLAGATILGGGFSVSTAAADVNDFSFSSMHATYLLGVDGTGRSTLTTIEKLTAVFPESDQNHGIQRAIPVDYDGHGTNLRLESVEDGNGVALPYTAEESRGFLVVTIASENFVHGDNTYVLTYTQRDVILKPADGGGKQEFYWDVNGTGWAQPFDNVVAVVLMPGWLASSLTGPAACYQGAANSHLACSALDRAALGVTAQFTARAKRLAPGENLTVAIEFAPGTFAQRQTAYFASPWAIPLLALAIVSVGIFALTLIIRRTRWRDHPGRGIIVAEYGPPPTITPLMAATVFGRSSKAVAAAIMSLAVSGNLRILDEGEITLSGPSAWGRRGTKAGQEFVLELISPEGVQSEERELLAALFGDQLVPGAQRGLSAVDVGVNRKLSKLRSRVAGSSRNSGIRGSIGTIVPSVLIGVSGLVAITAILLAISMAAEELGGATPFLLAMLVVVAALLTLVFSVNVHPLTASGAALRDHLKGLREYISLAETDRLRVLQSPKGTLRVPVDTTDLRLRLKLTEKVLPYAVLFGLEKEWSTELANLYAASDTQPTWYGGTSGFNAMLFAASLSTFASTASSSWAGASSSSSMGGSGGGGFSGGGGGGGGGGGV
ncbi:hypothetical protein GCM10027022_04220 [Alpinimonas psychrophila]|uniref:Putative membrane protein YgcG n=1 Tax=Alpinimonas psychrophila TaxID=748908 RepID=A0A7W3JS48_9MICO|nr:DUF2207 domain-containing protein [Alpinimonas psychrophila]MBA8828234.1 putative membrane protein YgcG [Alpinimonas psychrophila]